MNTFVCEVIFWGCVGTIVYNYLGYPCVLFVLAVLAQAKSDFLFLLGRKERRCQLREYVPEVAVLVSVYNEKDIIQGKIKNLQEIDYPSSRLTIFVGLDAPTDTTPELFSHLDSPQLRVLHFRTRRGKLAVLRDLAQQTAAEILVFTDANTIFDRTCVRSLVRHFADPAVGAVSGEEIRVAGRGTEPLAESLYWRYESALRVMESRLNCSLAVNGSVWAVRRSLFHTGKNSFVEDFQIPLEIRFAGHRVVYDPEAVAIEEIAPTLTSQFERRVRLGAGSYQSLICNLSCLNPTKGLAALSYFSHRVLRWLVPPILVLLFFCNIWIAARPLFCAFLVTQCLFYAAAFTGYWRKMKGKSVRLFSLPLGFCLMNLAMLVGLFRYLGGRQSTTWKVTARGMPTEALCVRGPNEP